MHLVTGIPPFRASTSRPATDFISLFPATTSSALRAPSNPSCRDMRSVQWRSGANRRRATGKSPQIGPRRLHVADPKVRMYPCLPGLDDNPNPIRTDERKAVLKASFPHAGAFPGPHLLAGPVCAATGAAALKRSPFSATVSSLLQVCHSAEYAPPLPSSSSSAPISTIRPPNMTTTRSASSAVWSR